MQPCRAFARLAHSDDDTVEERRRKDTFMPIGAVNMTLVLAVWAAYWDSYFLQALWWALLWMFITFAVGLVVPLVTRRLSIKFIGWCYCNWAFALLLCDLSSASAAAQTRSWTLVILVMDVFLALNVPRTYQHVVLSATVTFLAVAALEDGFRLGLYDIESFTEDSSRVVGKCDCANPPCPDGGTAFLGLAINSFILFVDFYATRGFAEGVRAEQAKMAASIKGADQVAAGLAMFDLSAAEMALDTADRQMPEPLVRSFRTLTANLASYKPYLPQSCFEDAAPKGREEAEAKLGAVESSQETAEALVGLRLSITVDRSLSRTPPVSRRMPSRPTSGISDTAAWARRRSTMSRSSREHSESSPRSSVSGTSPLGEHCAARASLAAHAPQWRRVSLLSCNRGGFLANLALMESLEVSHWLAAQVERFAAIVNDLGGLADLISGDHLSASYGAVRIQGSSRTSATRAAVTMAASDLAERREMAHTAAVCHGRALCGDFGSATCQRFMVLGGVSAFALVAERCAAAWGTAALIDAAVHADAEQTWTCRVRKYVIFPKMNPRPVALWEVLAERMDASASREAGEWMYELERAAANPWQPYNEAVALWVAGSYEDALAAAAPPACRDDVAAALAELALQLRGGAPAPLCKLTPAAVAGGSAPLGTRSESGDTDSAPSPPLELQPDTPRARDADSTQ